MNTLKIKFCNVITLCYAHVNYMNLWKRTHFTVALKHYNE